MKVAILVIIVAATLGVFGFLIFRSTETIDIHKASIPQKELPLLGYEIAKLKTISIPKSPLTIIETLKADTKFTSYLWEHNFDPTLSSKASKKVTGVMNVPTSSEGASDTEGYPVVLMFRGYVDQSIYEPGVGTRRVAEKLVQNGYITIAPDFLGYGKSDGQAGNVLESRFQSYTTALSVLSAIDTLPNWDHKNLFVWGHSNGGLIALTTLEVTSLPLPTVLWAPVSKPFPYSVLYYTDESEDKGKFLRREISKFEEDYDVENYSFDNYLEFIKAPVQLHQGTVDDVVPVSWSNTLRRQLSSLDLEVGYYTYPGADHNLMPSWNLAVNRTLEFYNSHKK